MKQSTQHTTLITLGFLIVLSYLVVAIVIQWRYGVHPGLIAVSTVSCLLIFSFFDSVRVGTYRGLKQWRHAVEPKLMNRLRFIAGLVLGIVLVSSAFMCVHLQNDWALTQVFPMLFWYVTVMSSAFAFGAYKHFKEKYPELTIFGPFE